MATSPERRITDDSLDQALDQHVDSMPESPRSDPQLSRAHPPAPISLGTRLAVVTSLRHAISRSGPA